jgi:hypothetical protein
VLDGGISILYGLSLEGAQLSVESLPVLGHCFLDVGRQLCESWPFSPSHPAEQAHGLVNTSRPAIHPRHQPHAQVVDILRVKPLYAQP